MRTALVLVVVVAILAAGAWWYATRGDDTPAWRTSEVERQEVREVVSATGTLQAVQTVEVGAQVSGIVARLGADFNDEVRAGQVLARIDPTLLQADVAAAEARLAEERAMEVRLGLALRRVGALHAQKITTDDELDAARAEHAVAEAQVRAAEVALDRSRRNLDYATITAPIDGTVVRRDVEVGQTVNAGLSAPKLFLLAGDLARMHILAAVDESDVGRIREGQAVSFTVQAWPDRTFSGTVEQVRLQSASAESVVTYTVVVTVDNTDRALLPGMTATAEFVVAVAPETLCVPNAALRFRPDAGVTVVGGEAPAGEAAAGGKAEGAGRRRGGGRPGRGGPTNTGTLHVPEGGSLRAVPVSIGLRGAACVEVNGEGVDAGLTVVTGVERAATGTTTASPFGTPGAPSR